MTRNFALIDTDLTPSTGIRSAVLDRNNAADYLGVGLRTFDEYVAMGLIPKIEYPGTIEKPSKKNGLAKPRVRSSHRVGFWIKHLNDFLVKHTVGASDGEEV